MCILGRLLNFTSKYNYTKLSKIIIDYKPEIVDYNEKLFYEVCETGNIELAQHIYFKIDQFDLLIDYENIFINACDNQQLEMALWILSTNQILNSIAGYERLLIQACTVT